ncbi:hypothetical protein LZ31DRAFT_601155 [Colletotrichum somersetense]|nr:hypothetical protein LZ31DRAFT_601155 [Colletotrichum somersetense]
MAARAQLDGLFEVEYSQILREDGGRWKVMETLYLQLKESATSAAAEALGRIIKANKDLIRGTSDGLDNLSPQGTQPASARDRRAGTGGTTAMALPALQSAYGEHMYTGIDLHVPDILYDPAEQGLVADLEIYDLVIATNVLHATIPIQDTLRNVCKRVLPRGPLFMQEVSPVSKWPGMVMGVLPEWLHGPNDDRPEALYMDEQWWDRGSKSAEFSGLRLSSLTDDCASTLS